MIPRNALVTVTVDDGQPDTMTLAEFFDANESMVETGEADDVAEALSAGRAYVGGGGAAPIFRIEAVKV